jgi:hypothetical protein
MTGPWAAAILLLLAEAAVSKAAASGVTAPRVVVGTAHVVVRGDGGDAASHLAFAAAVDPPALRLELVRGGRALAMLWWEGETVAVLALGDPPLLHEGPATRATLEAALRLPFCPADLLFALRGGHAPVPRCSAGDAGELVTRSGRIVGLRRTGERGEGAIELSSFARGGSEEWARRVVLRAEGGTAEVRILARHGRELAPPRPTGRAWDLARRVSAAEVARELGLVEEAAP